QGRECRDYGGHLQSREGSRGSSDRDGGHDGTQERTGEPQAVRRGYEIYAWGHKTVDAQGQRSGGNGELRGQEEGTARETKEPRRGSGGVRGSQKVWTDLYHHVRLAGNRHRPGEKVNGAGFLALLGRAELRRNVSP